MKLIFSLLVVFFAFCTLSQAKDLKDGYVVKAKIDERQAIYKVTKVRIVEQQTDLPSNGAGMLRFRGEILAVAEGNLCSSSALVSEFNTMKVPNPGLPKNVEFNAYKLRLFSIGNTFRKNDGCFQYSTEVNVVIPFVITAFIGAPEYSLYQNHISLIEVPLSYEDTPNYSKVFFKVEYHWKKGWSVSDLIVKK